MRFVIYDDATLEPITVVNIRGFTERDIEEHSCRYRLAVPSNIPSSRVHSDTPILDIMRIVELKFERMIRTRPETKELQGSWMCFTKQEELALLLVPAWLPGQRGAIEHIQQHNERLSEILLKLIRLGE